MVMSRRTVIKSRTITFEERVEIVRYFFSHQASYKETAEKFNVSYQQVYVSVKKYEQDGLNGLHDRRGKPLPRQYEDPLEVDQLREKNRLLLEEIQKLRLEISVLRKLEQSLSYVSSEEDE